MIIYSSQQPKHAANSKLIISVIDHHISQWDAIPKYTVPTVVYECETLFIIFWEELRLRIFENRY
jgi:hypothetical protein